MNFEQTSAPPDEDIFNTEAIGHPLELRPDVNRLNALGNSDDCMTDSDDEKEILLKVRFTSLRTATTRQSIGQPEF